ncbi:MAG: hypothetical protein HGA65_18770 [Oscillochloris sp.]|nr:hypothetical protein [Oscillochloris sp.]
MALPSTTEMAPELVRPALPDSSRPALPRRPIIPMPAPSEAFQQLSLFG